MCDGCSLNPQALCVSRWTCVKIKIAILAVSLVGASQAAAATFDAFYTFGDSSVDSGWWAGALNGQCGPVAAPCTTGNPTEDAHIASAIAHGGTGAPVGVGLMNTQILASYYGLTSIPANQPGGTNYAISGSLSAVTAGSGNLNPNVNLPSTIGQISSYLVAHGNVADPAALYLISSGGNDVTYAQNNFGGIVTAEEAYLSNQASSLASAVHSLQLVGAKNIVLNGLAGSGALAVFFTATLESDLSLDGVKFVSADINSLVQMVEANPTLYGFTAATVLPGVPGPNTGSACESASGTGWGQFCADTTTPSPDYSDLRSVDSEQTSFWSDDQHFSAAGQLIEANYEFGLIQADINTTPLPAALPLFATGLGAMGLLGWRRKQKTADIAA
jgi:outer membrane lipase/esterase